MLCRSAGFLRSDEGSYMRMPAGGVLSPPVRRYFIDIPLTGYKLVFLFAHTYSTNRADRRTAKV